MPKWQGNMAVPDHIVDTNVLIVASAADLASPFDGTHVPVDLALQVLHWLTAFREDPLRRLVLDEDMKIYGEYRNKLTDQDFGLLAVHQKMASAELVRVAYDADGHGVVPEALVALDPSDRKFAAAALAADCPTTVVNCSDTDWLQVEAACNEVGLRVEHILEQWLRGQRRARR